MEWWCLLYYCFLAGIRVHSCECANTNVFQFLKLWSLTHKSHVCIAYREPPLFYFPFSALLKFSVWMSHLA